MWTPSARRYPSFREPSCRWNIGSLSRKSTLRSLVMPLSPAFKDSISWLTAAVLFRGQTLQMVTVVALALAHSTKSLYWAVMPVTSRSSLSVSQSFPPPMRMMREKGLSIGSTVTCHQQPRPGAPPPDLRRLQRVPRHEKLWNYVTWPAWENSNVFLFNWCLCSSEISDCKSP